MLQIIDVTNGPCLNKNEAIYVMVTKLRCFSYNKFCCPPPPQQLKGGEVNRKLFP